MNNTSKVRNNDLLPWAPPRVGVPVERRDAWEVVMHGARAGLRAGVALGMVAPCSPTTLGGRFDFAAALIAGPEALAPSLEMEQVGGFAFHTAKAIPNGTGASSSVSLLGDCQTASAASSVISVPARACDTGQCAFAASACFANVA